MVLLATVTIVRVPGDLLFREPAIMGIQLISGCLQGMYGSLYDILIQTVRILELTVVKKCEMVQGH